MAASTYSLTALTDDSGSAASPAGDGTILNNNWFQTVLAAAVSAMFAGTGSYATLTLGGKLTVEGFGTATFSAGGTGGQIMSVRNTTAGTGNYSQLQLGNDASATATFFQSFSSTFTSSGRSQASGTLWECIGAGGISIAANNASGVIRFYSGGTTERMRLATTGALSLGTTTGFGGGTINLAGTAQGLTFNHDNAEIRWKNTATTDKWSLYLSTADLRFFTYAISGDMFRFGTSNSRPYAYMPSGAYGTGASAFGSLLEVGYNSSGGGAPASLALQTKAGVPHYIWVDTTGDLRIDTSPPSESGGDVTGTVVGTQS